MPDVFQDFIEKRNVKTLKTKFTPHLTSNVSWQRVAASES